MKRAQLGELLGISASMVSRLAKKGMPTGDVERAKRWRARHLRVRVSDHEPRANVAGDSTTAVADQAQQQSLGPAAEGESSGSSAPATTLTGESGYQEARTRQAQADARLAELKLAETEGHLVRIDQVRAELASRLAPVREALLQIPARIAPELANQSDAGRIQTMLEAEIYRVLTPLGRKAGEEDSLAQDMWAGA